MIVRAPGSRPTAHSQELLMSLHGRPQFAKPSFGDEREGRLQPYIRTFAAATLRSLMGFAGRIPVGSS